MVAAGWQPTVAVYLGRVTKARILQAVGEAKNASSVQLRKDDMAEQVAALLTGAGWLPEPLRTAGYVLPLADGEGAGDPVNKSVDAGTKNEDSKALSKPPEALAA